MASELQVRCPLGILSILSFTLSINWSTILLMIGITKTLILPIVAQGGRGIACGGPNSC